MEPTIEDLNALLALSVRCKQCFCSPGQPCEDYLGRPAGRFHFARRRAAGLAPDAPVAV